MDVTQTQAARIPAENLRVDRAAFVQLWSAAERHQGSPACDPFTAGVLDTCRWLGGATVRPQSGPWFPAPAPLTPGRGRALPELIDAEHRVAAGSFLGAPDRMAPAERERIAGVLATFDWAWARTGAPPLLGGHRSHQYAPERSATAASIPTEWAWSDATHCAI